MDPISIDAVAKTNKYLVDSGYAVKIETDFSGTPSTLAKVKASGANGPLSELKIEILDSEGTAIEIWTLKAPFLKSAKYGDLDYSSDDLRTVELSIRYDWAECDTSQGKSTDGELKTKFFEAGQS